MTGYRALILGAAALLALPAAGQTTHDPQASAPPGGVVLSEPQMSQLLDEVARLHKEDERLKRQVARAPAPPPIGLYDDRPWDGSIVWDTCRPGTASGRGVREARLLVCRRKDGSVAFLTERALAIR